MQKIIDWVDEQLSPITVLYFQKLAKKYTVLLICIQTVAVIAILLSAVHVYENGQFDEVSTLFGSTGLLYVTIYLVLGGFAGNIMYLQLVKIDPLLFNTILSRKEIAWGSVQFGLLNSLAMACTITGPISFFYMMRVVSFRWVYLYPFLCLVMGTALLLSYTAFMSATKPNFLIPLIVLPALLGVPIGFFLGFHYLFTGNELSLSIFGIMTYLLESPLPWLVITAMLLLVYRNAVITINFNLGGKKRTFLQRWGAAYLSLTVNTFICGGAWMLLSVCR